MRLQPIISGLIIGGIGFAIKYFELINNSYVYWGVMGLGGFLILLGLFMRKRYY